MHVYVHVYCWIHTQSHIISFVSLQSVSMGELYGEVNKLTMEWRDGLMAVTVRHCVKVQAHDTTVQTHIYIYWSLYGYCLQNNA